MIRQRVIHDGVLCDLWQRDVLAHVVQVRAVVLPHDEKLAAVAEHGRTDAALLEPRVLLNDGDVPAIELAKLRVRFLHDFLAAGNVEEARDFLRPCVRQFVDELPPAYPTDNPPLTVTIGSLPTVSREPAPNPPFNKSFNRIMVADTG